MSDFKAKMHRIRFPLELRHADPAGGAYSDHPAGGRCKYLRGLLVRGGRRWTGTMGKEGGGGRVAPPQNSMIGNFPRGQRSRRIYFQLRDRFLLVRSGTVTSD